MHKPFVLVITLFRNTETKTSKQGAKKKTTQFMTTTPPRVCCFQLYKDLNYTLVNFMKI